MADGVIADVATHDTITATARAYLAVVDGHFALAGLSMGGYVALEILRQAPERVGRLAMFNTSTLPQR